MERKGAMVSNHPMPGVFSEELLILDHGQGCEVIDSSGKNYLDFGSGISVNALGYGVMILQMLLLDKCKN